MRTSILVLGLAASIAACAHKGASSSGGGEGKTRAKEQEPDIDAGMIGADTSVQASAQLTPKSGNTALAGHATFNQTSDGVELVLHVTGASPGDHGAHIHEKGDCSDPEAKSAGGHWNPAQRKHGAPPPSAAHLGDLGNITVAADGTGTLKLTSDAWKLGDGSAEDLVGKAVVIHAGPDDLATDPAGNSGARIGCGVIEK